MTEQGLDDGRKGPHRTKNSEQLKSNYIERELSIPSEPRLKSRIMVIDDNSDIGLTLRMGLEINMDAAREVHPLKSIGCFIKKPITADTLVKRIRAELE